MIEQETINQLRDRLQIMELANTYAAAVDSRDWELFRSLFAEKLFLDFRTFHPSLYKELTFDELLEIARNLSAFDATQHLITNHRITLDRDRATCVAYMHAGHFIKRDGQDHVCFLYGFYTYEFARTGDGWKIDRYGLQVTAQHGDPRVFEWAGLSYEDRS